VLVHEDRGALIKTQMSDMSNAIETIEDLKARLERTQKRLDMFEELYLCKRCGELGHASAACMKSSMPIGTEVDPNDVFLHSKVDRRIIDRLATVMWQLVLTFLPVHDVIPHVPRTCRYLNDEVVWSKSSGPLLWGEMAPGTLDAVVCRFGYYDTHRVTWLLRACDWGAPVAHVCALLSGGANVHYVDHGGWTVLYWACRGGHDGIVRELLSSGADPSFSNRTGCTLLQMAIYYGHSTVATTLIAAGANIYSVDRNGKTALIWACIGNNIECVRILIAAGADVTMRDKLGRTALDIACNKGFEDIVHIL
jgi:ribosomal protein L32